MSCDSSIKIPWGFSSFSATEKWALAFLLMSTVDHYPGNTTALALPRAAGTL